MRSYDGTSEVERLALASSGAVLRYAPRERMGVVTVPDFPSLGRLASLRFLEWLQRNPEGVICLPTGKTPEPFIACTTRYLRQWDEREVRAELAAWGLAGARPDMRGYRFVQMDEFYPMDPSHENSFTHYVRRFYFGDFGLSPERALLLDAWGAGEGLEAVFPGAQVDLSLRFRAPVGEAERRAAEALRAADQAAMEYEARLEEWGGIGFFLGGIGPDGHIGFNVRGSDHYSTTRLSGINYETAAAAAVDLGGIESARHRAVLTIGLHSITRHPSATLLVIAAGESKARVVREAVELEPEVLRPASALQARAGARFYLTKGAASLLTERQYQALCAQPDRAAAQERILLDLACRRRKRVVDLRAADGRGERLAELLPQEDEALAALASRVDAALRERILRGGESGGAEVFLHTAPHHDDVLLGYLPALVHLVRNPGHAHYFAILTSGFTSVTNAYLREQLANLQTHLERGTLGALLAEGYFNPRDVCCRNRDLFHYLDGLAAGSPEMQREAEARRMLRNLADLAGVQREEELRAQLAGLLDYTATRYAGQKDAPPVQQLKGMLREWEEELAWGHLGFNCEHIFHLRLPFYTGDLFTPQPEFEQDVQPVLRLLEDLRPSVVTVALDPEGSGPDTHYKVMQTVSAALQSYLARHPERTVRVWGYRNVWYRFHPSEANLHVPVSMNSLAILRSAFHACFGSQRSASFPSYEYDGPFCDLAQKIMVEQYAALKVCLGREFFHRHPVPRLRATRGMNFLCEMAPAEFFARARALRKLTEARDGAGQGR